jgi:hypothetical protein
VNLTPSITFLLEKERLKYSEHTALLKFVDRDLGVVESSRRKVCILGAGSSFYPLKPYEEEAWELWCCNGLWRYGFDPLGSWRADRWFEMHPYEAQSEVDLLRLKRAPIMVYGLRPTDISWIPTLVTDPLRRLLALPYY